MGRNTLKSIVVEFIDIDGNNTILDFRTLEDLNQFLRDEGDNIVEYRFIKKST